MGKVFIEGGSFGMDPDEVTARANDVVEGKTTIDDEGEIVSGKLEVIPKSSINGIDKAMKMIKRKDEYNGGKFHSSSQTGNALLLPIKPNNNKRYVLDNDVELLYVPVPDLEPDNLVENANVLGLQGGIKRLTANSDLSNVMLPYERNDYWGKGKYIHSNTHGDGVIASLKSPGAKACLERDCDFVFLPEANLTAENIRKDVYMFGVKGSMVDYSKGGMAFINATFDNRLLTGVATSRSRIMQIGNKTLFMDRWDYGKDPGNNLVNYQGIRNGGLSVELVSRRNNTGSINIYGGTVLARSINLAPFKRLKIGIKSINLKGESNHGYATARLGVFLISTTSFRKEDIHFPNVSIPSMIGGSDSFFFEAIQDGAFSVPNRTYREFNNVQQYVDIDITNINGHYFMGVGFSVDTLYSEEFMEGEVVVNSIEFVN